MALNNVPLSGQSLNVSRPLISQNFTTIDTAFSQDHVGYGSGTQGQHKQITFPSGLVTGQPFTYLAGQIGLQNLNQAPTSRPDLWMSRGAAAAFPITGYASVGSTAWTYMPSGFKIIAGTNTTTSSRTKTIIYSDAGNGGIATFPGFTTVFYIGLTRIDASNTTNNLFKITADPGSNNLQFTAKTTADSGDYPFTWFAIGI